MTSNDSELNRADVVDQIRTVFEQYEAALRKHDVAALNDFFLDSPTTVRYGVTEHSVGMDAIRTYRSNAKPLPPGRRLRNTIITTYGTATASVSTEFTSPDSPLIGRQTQAWVLTREGWKIIAAHVSQISPNALRRDCNG